MKFCYGCMKEIQNDQIICPHCGYRQDTLVEEAYYLIPGTVLSDRYLVGKVLGYGGFGVTYIGQDLLLKRTVAIKEYFPSDYATRGLGSQKLTIYSGDAYEQFQMGLDSFLSEARRLAQFNDVDGIVRIYDCIQENETGYIVMEYLVGHTVKEMLDEKGRLSFDEAKKIVIRVLRVLSEVHRAGIIHRDIAPDNIFITESGEMKLLDFGAARYAMSAKSKSLSVILKPGYAPEEQYRSHGEQGPWTDIYGLGATFYRMITGERPEESIERMVEDHLVKPSSLGVDIPPDQESALLKSLSVRKEGRYQNVEDFLASLVKETNPASVSESENAPASAAEEKKPGKKIPLQWIVAGIGGILIVGGLGFFLKGRQEAGNRSAVVSDAVSGGRRGAGFVSESEENDSQENSQNNEQQETAAGEANQPEKETDEETEEKRQPEETAVPDKNEEEELTEKEPTTERKVQPVETVAGETDESESESESAKKSELQSESESESSKESEPQSEAEPIAATESASQSETELIAPSESAGESEFESESESANESEPQSESESESAKESELQSESESESSKESELQSESESESAKESELQSEAESIAASEGASQSESESTAMSESTSQSESESIAMSESISQSESESSSVAESEKQAREAQSAREAAVSMGDESWTLSIHNDTELTFNNMQVRESGADPENVIFDMATSGTDGIVRFAIEEGKLYDIRITSMTTDEILGYYGLDLSVVREIWLNEDNGYAYTVYIADKAKDKTSLEQYAVKTLAEEQTRYSLTGLNMRKLPDTANGEVVTKLSLGDEIHVIGQAKGIVDGEESDWYLIRTSSGLGYISASSDYTTDDKALADQKIEEKRIADEQAAAAAAQQWSAPSGGGNSGGGGSKKSSGGDGGIDWDDSGIEWN